MSYFRNSSQSNTQTLHIHNAKYCGRCALHKKTNTKMCIENNLTGDIQRVTLSEFQVGSHLIKKKDACIQGLLTSCKFSSVNLGCLYKPTSFIDSLKSTVIECLFVRREQFRWLHVVSLTYFFFYFSHFHDRNILLL